MATIEEVKDKGKVTEVVKEDKEIVKREYVYTETREDVTQVQSRIDSYEKDKVSLQEAIAKLDSDIAELTAQITE